MNPQEVSTICPPLGRSIIIVSIFVSVTNVYILFIILESLWFYCNYLRFSAEAFLTNYKSSRFVN